MKTRIFVLLAALTTIFVGQSLHAQYPGQMLPGYGYPAQPAVMPVSHPGMLPAMMPGQPMLAPGMGNPVMQAGLGPQFGAPAAFIPAAPALAPPSQVIPASAHGVAQHGGKCNGKCGGKCSDCCNTGGYDKRLAFYGDFIFFRARDSEVAFAVPIDGPIVAPPIPRVEVGPVGVADLDFEPNFRLGMAFNLNNCMRATAEYTKFESGTTEQVVTQVPFVIESLVQHPSVSSASSDFLQATADYGINHNVVDVAIHNLFNYCEDYQLGWMLGTRYGQHEQILSADFAGSGTENVSTDIDFYGVGLRGGLEFERYVGCQWLVYANGYGGVLAGEFRASYLQTQSFDSRVVSTSWKAGRIVSNFDLELGAGRVSRCGNYRLSAGYVYSTWTNVVQTDEWIRAVHSNDFIGMDSAFTLDGVTARFEARY